MDDAAEKRKRTVDREDVKKIILKNIEKKNREQMRAVFASVGQEEGPNANDVFSVMNEPDMTDRWHFTPFH